MIDPPLHVGWADKARVAMHHVNTHSSMSCTVFLHGVLRLYNCNMQSYFLVRDDGIQPNPSLLCY
eukprot:7606-Eustigmatos_ZCMA.PRE.1